MPYPSKKFRQNPFTSLRVIRRTDRQTDRQTDRIKSITSFFGGGNNTTTTTTTTVLFNNSCMQRVIPFVTSANSSAITYNYVMETLHYIHYNMVYS